MKRYPAVADRFYPGKASALQRTLYGLIPDKTGKTGAIAVVSPHAGYVYSGAVAGETLANVIIPEHVVILGPNHHGRGAPLALMSRGSWEMPLGDVPISEKLSDAILNNSSIIVSDTAAHQYEHSLEVQVPFLQYFQKALAIAPIVVSHIPFMKCLEAGKDLATAIREFGEPVLIVASSDMTHYESRQSASAKDKTALDRILALDPQGLYDTVIGNNISMCGIMPVTVAMVAALELGCSEARLVRYTDSGEMSGDTNQVVGYAGLVLR